MLRVMEFAADKHREAGKGGVVSDWYRKELSARVRQEFDGLLRDLGKFRAKEWLSKDFKPLTGAHSGISELRFKMDGVEWRPLCFLLPSADVGGENLDVLVLLVGAFKKMGIWTPRGARDTAVRLKKQVLADRSVLHDYKP